MRTPPYFRFQELQTYGDFFVRVEHFVDGSQRGRPERTFYSSITKALERRYGRRMNRAVRKAIATLKRDGE